MPREHVAHQFTESDDVDARAVLVPGEDRCRAVRRHAEAESVEGKPELAQLDITGVVGVGAAEGGGDGARRRRRRARAHLPGDDVVHEARELREIEPRLIVLPEDLGGARGVERHAERFESAP